MGVVCVLVIAVLWGGGLGMIAPALKVLLSEEGLHGWAWNTMTGDRLDLRITHTKVPPTLQKQHHLPETVVGITRVKSKGRSQALGLKENEWIVGLEGTDPLRKQMRADVLTRTLGLTDPGRIVRLRIFNPFDEAVRTVDVELGSVRFLGRMLGAIAERIPEPTNMSERFAILVWLLVIALIVNLLRDVMRFVQEYLVQSAVYRGVMDLRCENYGVALRLPVTFFSEKGTSDTMSRFVQDPAELSRGQVTLFGKTLVEPGKAVASVGMAMVFSWKLTLVAMVAGPPAFFLIYRFGRRMKKVSRRALESWSGLLGVLEETLTGIRVVKAYTMEGSERKRFFQTNRRLFKQQRRIAAINAASAPSVEALGITAAMIAVAGAGYLVLDGQMDAGIFMGWMACLAAMFDPVRKLAKVVTRFQRAESAATRIFELHDREQERSLPGAPMLGRHTRNIEFRNVRYRYPRAAEDALRNINLNIDAGQTVAIVGPNGSGKTTLVSLVPRLLDPDEGAVLIDGCDISQYSLRSVRRQIGLVTQETVLFHATIGENISYGLRRPKPAQVMEASKKAFVDEFVRELPDGYDTMVGERGATLSGGQKQRIAMARAFLRDPAILIFDEAMSQVDADSERRIHDAMGEFVKDRTTLVVAHRFATVMSADRIVVMDAGAIVDSGTHDELLERCRLYHHLYRTQFVDTGGDSDLG